MGVFSINTVRQVWKQIFAIQVRHLSTGIKEAESWLLPTGMRSPRIKLAISLKKRKYREKHEQILLEGWRLIKDALLAKAKAVDIFYSDKRLLEKLPPATVERLLIPVDSNVMKMLSSAVTPPGIVGVFRRPPQGGSVGSPAVEPEYQKQRLPLTVICDGVKDPTNLGTLIRVSAAAGCRSLITTKGSMDVWDPKVLRCAAGGHFHLPLIYSLPWESISNIYLESTRIFMADNNVKRDSSKAHYEVDWTLSPSALIIGGETTGPSNEARRLIQKQGGQPIRIPMVESVDSLSAGVAASVIIYEAYRQAQPREHK